MNQFVATAVAEKLAAMSTAAYFAKRKSRADLQAFQRLLRRKSGESPRERQTKARRIRGERRESDNTPQRPRKRHEAIGCAIEPGSRRPASGANGSFRRRALARMRL